MKLCPFNENSRSQGGKKWLLSMLLLVLFSAAGMAQSITGYVFDSLGEPLPGASVVAKGTTNGTITDIDGKFTLAGVSRGTTLEFSYVGYLKQEAAAQDGMRITLKEDSQLTEEVVVIGYGTVKKSDLTGSIGSVSSDKIERMDLGAGTGMLQGRIAGVNITSTDGNGGKSIRIRGTTSLNKSNEPLWVVDGVIGAPQPADFHDIESVEVLKDASSTAIYGAQGANGVILITTKKPQEKTRVTFQSRLNWQTVYKKPDLLNPYEYAEAYNYVNGANAIPAATVQEFADGTNPGVDWMDELVHTGVGQTYTLGVSGGGKKTQYRLELYRNDNKGRVNLYRDKSQGLNVNVVSELTDWVKVSGMVSVSNSKSHNWQDNDVLHDVYTYSPIMDLINADGVYLRDPYNSIHQNPLADYKAQWQDGNSQSATAFGDVTFKIIDGLTFTSSGLYSQSSGNAKRYTSTKVDLDQAAGAITGATSAGHSWRNVNNLTYDTYINKDHHLTATAVAEYTVSKSNSDIQIISNVSNDDLGYWGVLNGTPTQVQAGYSNSGMISYMARAMYAYQGKYMLNATIRTDGASQLSEDKRWSTFPSVGIGWNIHEESFWNKDIVNQLKLRASWGISGNAGIGAYSTMSTLSNDGKGYTYGLPNGTGYTGYILSTATNPNLKWERTKQYNIGVDLGLLNNRLTLTLDAYFKKTYDLLFQKDIPNYSGGGTSWVNQGQMNNKGLEITLNAVPITNKNFTWDSNFTASYNRNKIVDLAGEDHILNGSFIMKPGAPVGVFYLYDVAGFNDNGDMLYRKLDGTLTTTPDGDQRIMVGKSIPDWIFGWNNTFTYKNWDVNTLFRFTSHYDRLNVGRFYGGAMTGPSRFITIAESYYLSWDHVADKNHARYPNLKSSSGLNTSNSTQYLEGGTFFRFQNLSIGYTFKKEQTKFANIRLGLSIQNLFYISGYRGLDPETVTSGGSDTSFGIDDGSVPMPRTYAASVRFEF